MFLVIILPQSSEATTAVPSYPLGIVCRIEVNREAPRNFKDLETKNCNVVNLEGQTNFGYFSGQVQISTLFSPQLEPSTRVLEVRYPFDSIEAEVLESSSSKLLTSSRIGKKDFDRLNKNLKNPSLLLPISGDNLLVRLKVSSQTSIVISTRLYPNGIDFAKAYSLDFAVLGIFYGVLCLIFLQSITNYAVIGDRVFLVYLFFAAFYFLFQTSANRVAEIFLWSPNSWIASRAVPLFGFLQTGFMTILLLEFFSSRKARTAGTRAEPSHCGLLFCQQAPEPFFH